MNSEIDLTIREVSNPDETGKCLQRAAKYRFDGNTLFKMTDDCIKENLFDVLDYLRKSLNNIQFKDV